MITGIEFIFELGPSGSKIALTFTNDTSIVLDRGFFVDASSMTHPTGLGWVQANANSNKQLTFRMMSADQWKLTVKLNLETAAPYLTGNIAYEDAHPQASYRFPNSPDPIPLPAGDFQIPSPSP